MPPFGVQSVDNLTSHDPDAIQGDQLNRSRQALDGIASLDLRLTDLRAHFEAQLRTVRRAEGCLLRCRDAQDALAFDAAVDAFREQLAVVTANRKTIGTLAAPSDC
jgi:hypothetical protein